MATAGGNGRTLEQQVQSLFMSRGFTLLSYKEFSKGHVTGKYIVTHVPYRTIYGTQGKTEFLVVDGDRKIRVECKWQQCSGSVDEKYPYLILNCMDMPESEIIILLDGGGYKQMAKDWLVAAARDGVGGKGMLKNVRVLALSEFISWVNKEWPRK